MCSNYYPTTDRSRLELVLGGSLPQSWSSANFKQHVWKGHLAPFIRSHPYADVVSEREILAGDFGLLPSWSKERRIKFSTFNARSETVETTPSFRGAWAGGQRCIIPADWIMEPDWRTGKHIQTRIGRADGLPMGIAGLWDKWLDKKEGEAIHSFTMLTVNADGHDLMKYFHRPNEEKRMVVILPEGSYHDWLTAPVSTASNFFRCYPSDKLIYGNR